MLKWTCLAAIAGALAATPAAAQEKIPGAHGPAASDYHRMDMSDLMLDIQDLSGRLVEVEAEVQYSIGIVMLSAPRQPANMNFLFADDEGLPREDRRYLLERCGLMGCTITVRGEVGTVSFRTGVRLHAIVR